MTLNERLSAMNLKFKTVKTFHNPYMEDGHNMDHWSCVIRNAKRRMTVIFSKGLGHKGAPPTLEDVLDCLISDASGIENNTSFEEWCRNYGYDTDSRKAERTYRVITRQARQLKRVLGNDHYKLLLWETEQV